MNWAGHVVRRDGECIGSGMLFEGETEGNSSLRKSRQN
jgi:hypothetical protein